jgi:arsenate reductase (thioredoxin)
MAEGQMKRERHDLPTVLFVCEHGSAKSVVAAAHFNRLAEERGLPYQAISRGTDPDAAVHPAALAGLAADGLRPGAEPTPLAVENLAAATRVVAFSALPPSYRPHGEVEIWSVPPVSEDYELARSSIVDRVERLIEQLARPS